MHNILVFTGRHRYLWTEHDKGYHVASLMHFRRKMKKSLALARLPVWHENRKTGVVAAIEHLACLSDLNFSTSIDVGANTAPDKVEAVIGAAA